MRATWPRRRIVLLALAILLLPTVALLGWSWESSNFGVIARGRIYRSGQMSADSLARTIRQFHVRTVLNLRGVNAEQGWYHAERAATTRAGATQVDISMSSREWMSRAQLRMLVRVLDACDQPLLIHCQWGAERTGLVSAFAELLRPGATLEDARAQFSVRYLFLPVKDGKVMLAHLDQYADWLRARREPHSPDRFRLWAAHGFHPREPSREQWPYDPYPLVVVTRPESSSGTVAANGVEGVTR